MDLSIVWTACGHMEVTCQSASKVTLDDQHSVGYLLDIDVWQSGATRIL